LLIINENNILFFVLRIKEAHVHVHGGGVDVVFVQCDATRVMGVVSVVSVFSRVFLCSLLCSLLRQNQKINRGRKALFIDTQINHPITTHKY